MLTLLIALLAAPDCPDTKPKDFPGVVLKASFAYDRGCDFDAFVVDGKTYKDFSHVLPALAKGGWSDLKKRPGLALAWMQLRYDNAIESPASKLLEDGGVVVEGKYKPRPGMREVPEDERVAVKVKIGADGTVSGRAE